MRQSTVRHRLVKNDLPRGPVHSSISHCCGRVFSCRSNFLHRDLLDFLKKICYNILTKSFVRYQPARRRG
nr:MAG TPA_asm: hypothetical protein [Caudoviricetes sp.]